LRGDARGPVWFNDPVGSKPKEFCRFNRADVEKWKRLLQRSRKDVAG